MTEIFNLILENNIDMKINSFENGTLMIDVSEKEMKIAILELILKKLKNSY